MAIMPSKVEYEIGVDKHGRRLTMVREGDLWTLFRAAANQRDDDVRLDSLTTEMVRLMGAAVENERAR